MGTESDGIVHEFQHFHSAAARSYGGAFNGGSSAGSSARTGFSLSTSRRPDSTPWSLNTLPPSNHFGSNAYSLFNSQTWHPGPGMPSGLLPDLMEGLPTADRRIIGGPNPMVPPSLWSGPGPSPLERLLEQQKALRGGNSPTKNSKAEF